MFASFYQELSYFVLDLRILHFNEIILKLLNKEASLSMSRLLVNRLYFLECVRNASVISPLGRFLLCVSHVAIYVANHFPFLMMLRYIHCAWLLLDFVFKNTRSWEFKIHKHVNMKIWKCDGHFQKIFGGDSFIEEKRVW